MILDSSAILAILLDEPDAETYLAKLVDPGVSVTMSAGTYLECGIVVDGRKDRKIQNRYESLLKEIGVEVVPFTAQQSLLARVAYQKFGKGSGHPAKLNFGDCISYALAIDLDEPLLCKGEDFHHTDIEIA